MNFKTGLLLTGATGLLGRYLLRDLLLAGQNVVVLARDQRSQTATDRVGLLVDFWSEHLGRKLPQPTVLSADLALPNLGVSTTDRAWLARHCRAVVHAAAKVAMRRSGDGEPRRSNVEGTRRLLELCAVFGLSEFHHVSTAFVCGDRPGPIRERDLECGQQFHNDYEQSKYEAERLVRAAPRVEATVYRPSVIVGDSRTGYTSTYHGLYRFLELADRLADAKDARRKLPLRLPFSGTAPRNMVPVDWVSQAIVRLVERKRTHGRTFHLTSRRPIPARLIKTIAERVLKIDGVEFAGPDHLPNPTTLETMFLEHVQEYWPYLHGDPVFDRRQVRSALPDLPPPRVDGAALARMVRFALADRWGRANRPGTRRGHDCADYLERFFPQVAPRSALARIPLTVTVALEICGPGGGRWQCCWRDGALQSVRRAETGNTNATYRMDVATFLAVVRGTITPQEAFFNRRIDIRGDIETGLKLAVLFSKFANEFPYQPRPRKEARDGIACPR